MNKGLLLAAGLILVSPVIFAQHPPLEVKASVTRHGPEKGSLLIIGGNVGSTTSVWNKFTELAGGKDKGLDFTGLRTLVREKARAVLLIGSMTEKLFAAWNSAVPCTRATKCASYSAAPHPQGS